MNERKHHWPPEYCYYCGEPAVAGCDGVEHYIGTLVNGVPIMSLKDPESVVVWCDKPLCDEHDTQHGMTTKRGYVDSIDYCPKHHLTALHGIRPEIIVNK